MKNLCECIRIAAILITPFMPESAEKILNMLNVAAEARGLDAVCYCADEKAVWTTTVGPVLFPRLDVEKELQYLEELKAKMSAPAVPAIEIEPYSEEKVDFDTFCKSDFRAVKVK